MSSRTAIATPPPSYLSLLFPICHSLYPGILGGMLFVSAIHMTCAFFVRAAFSMLLILFLAPLALQYSTFRLLIWFLFLFLFLLWIWCILLPDGVFFGVSVGCALSFPGVGVASMSGLIFRLGFWWLGFFILLGFFWLGFFDRLGFFLLGFFVWLGCTVGLFFVGFGVMMVGLLSPITYLW